MNVSKPVNQYRKKAKKIEVVLEFLIFGIAIGVVEDVLAVTFATGEPITWKIIGIIVVIAIPFAFLGEIVADNVHLEKYIARVLRRKSQPR